MFVHFNNISVKYVKTWSFFLEEYNFITSLFINKHTRIDRRELDRRKVLLGPRIYVPYGVLNKYLFF